MKGLGFRSAFVSTFEKVGTGVVLYHTMCFIADVKYHQAVFEAEHAVLEFDITACG
jgi:hypothetical protein